MPLKIQTMARSERELRRGLETFRRRRRRVRARSASLRGAKWVEGLEPRLQGYGEPVARVRRSKRNSAWDLVTERGAQEELRCALGHDCKVS